MALYWYKLTCFTKWQNHYIDSCMRGTTTHWCPQWASYQIRNIAGCACAGNAGNVFPRRRFQRKPLVSDPGMHHGTCVTHVPWCMSGSLACSERGKRSRHSRRMRTRNFAYLARGPLKRAWKGNYIPVFYADEINYPRDNVAVAFDDPF